MRHEDPEPEDAAGLARLGTERRLEGRQADAAELYRRSLVLDPGQLDASVGLAALLCLQGNAAAAERLLDGLAGQHPGSVPVLVALGDARCELGRYRGALECYERALDEQPGHLGCRLGLARCLAHRPGLAPRLRSPERLAALLQDDDVDPALLAAAAAVLVRASPTPLEHPLLPVLLRSTIVTDLALERELTQARRELCLAPPRVIPEPAGALAAQCRLNEAAWAVGAEEEARLASAPDWVQAMYDPGGPPAGLAERARRIPALTEVSAGTSAAVREQYEANPYPRWERLSHLEPVDLDRRLRLLAGGRWEPPLSLRRPRVLVAGCGTGRELLSIALAWRPATLTGFDLSRASLAYTELMAERLGVEVDLWQADLLRLDGWEREFDVVVCAGVLHHLDDPLDGWRRLLRLLRPGGVMLLGLYSETARRGIAEAQEAVRRLGLPPTPEGIRAARSHLAGLPQDDPARDCTLLPDFFHASGCRDMLFHVREHRFTLPRIAAALDELGLEFLAFAAGAPVRRLAGTLFGPQPDLACWAELERLYPGTFLGMYQFWSRKREGTS